MTSQSTETRAGARPCARRSPSRVAITLCFAVASALALLLDSRLSAMLDRYAVPAWLDDHCIQLLRLSRAPGVFTWQLPVIFLVALMPPRRWRGAVMVALATAMAAIATHMLKWMVGRVRPFHEHTLAPYAYDIRLFCDGLGGLLKLPPNLSFPSGHTSAVFAAATGFAMLMPHWRVVFFAIATITGISRWAEGAHYASDVIVGAGVGIACAVMARALVERVLPLAIEEQRSESR